MYYYIFFYQSPTLIVYTRNSHVIILVYIKEPIKSRPHADLHQCPVRSQITNTHTRHSHKNSVLYYIIYKCDRPPSPPVVSINFLVQRASKPPPTFICPHQLFHNATNKKNSPDDTSFYFHISPWNSLKIESRLFWWALIFDDGEWQKRRRKKLHYSPVVVVVINVYRCHKSKCGAPEKFSLIYRLYIIITRAHDNLPRWVLYTALYLIYEIQRQFTSLSGILSTIFIDSFLTVKKKKNKRIN